MKKFVLFIIAFLTLLNENIHARAKKIKKPHATACTTKNCQELQKVFYTLQRSWDSDLQVYSKAAANMTNDEIILCYKDFLKKQNQTPTLKNPCFVIKCSKNLRDTSVSRVSNKKKSPYGIIEIHSADDVQSKAFGLTKTTHVTIEQAAFKINPTEIGNYEIINYKRSTFEKQQKGNVLFSRSTTQHVKTLPFPHEPEKQETTN